MSATQSKIFGFVLFGIAAVFITLGLRSESRKQNLKVLGKSEAGLITGARITSGSKNKKSHTLVVKWGEGDASHADSFTVRKSFFTTKVDGEGKIISSDVTVRHVPGQADTAIIEGGSTDESGMQWVGYAVALGAAYVTYKAFRKSAMPPPIIVS